MYKCLDQLKVIHEMEYSDNDSYLPMIGDKADTQSRQAGFQPRHMHTHPIYVCTKYRPKEQNTPGTAACLMVVVATYIGS